MSEPSGVYLFAFDAAVGVKRRSDTEKEEFMLRFRDVSRGVDWTEPATESQSSSL